jgi:hypothetical protein
MIVECYWNLPYFQKAITHHQYFSSLYTDNRLVIILQFFDLCKRVFNLDVDFLEIRYAET